ncbi:DUF5071 domain-containing protein [Clostridioides difficile]|nr:DUF5071 domain-containing protein [Clostridioides difficile]
MENIEELLPKDKFDNSNIEKLKLLSDEDIRPICYRLLEWMQDYNWPVAKKILPVLALHQELITPLIMNVLSEDDDDWKYWIISCLLPLFVDKNLEPIIPLVKRIAEKPTKWECEAEVDEISEVFLKRIL